MTTSRLASLRPAGAAGLALVAAIALAACSTPQTTPEPTASAAAPIATETPGTDAIAESDAGADPALHE